MCDSAPETKTQQIIFTGKVQGVGFRATTLSIARRHAVTGFVRNLPDRTVELVAQGKPAAINDFVAEVASNFRRNIHHIDRRPVENTGRFEAFDLRS